MRGVETRLVSSLGLARSQGQNVTLDFDGRQNLRLGRSGGQYIGPGVGLKGLVSVSISVSRNYLKHQR